MDFESLLRKISPILRRITYKVNIRYSFFNEEDLYQEAVIHLWEDFHKGRLNNKTDSYILQGCYFYLKNYIRKNHKRVSILSMDEPVGEENLDFKERLFYKEERPKGYIENLNSRILAETIRNNGLLPREKKILFFYADGLTTREIGARLGISHVMVVKLMSKIREKCQKYLDKD